MTLYVRTTMDDLELPIAVADSVKELAQMLNKTRNHVSSSLSRKYRGWYVIECDELTGGYGR